MAPQTSITASTFPLSASAAQSCAWLRAICAHLVAWAETCSRYQQAAALYGRLSHLSDAELDRRGLDRSTLAWDLCEAGIRGQRPWSSGEPS